MLCIRTRLQPGGKRPPAFGLALQVPNFAGAEAPILDTFGSARVNSCPDYKASLCDFLGDLRTSLLARPLLNRVLRANCHGGITCRSSRGLRLSTPLSQIPV